MTKPKPSPSGESSAAPRQPEGPRGFPKDWHPLDLFSKPAAPPPAHAQPANAAELEARVLAATQRQDSLRRRDLAQVAEGWPTPSPLANAAPLDALREALKKARAQIDRDRTGLAAALNRTVDAAKGRCWIPAGEWGCYGYEEHTVETMRKECGWLIEEVLKAADDGLRASGTLANTACREIDDILLKHAALASAEGASAAPRDERPDAVQKAVEEERQRWREAVQKYRDALEGNTRGMKTADWEALRAPLEGLMTDAAAAPLGAPDARLVDCDSSFHDDRGSHPLNEDGHACINATPASSPSPDALRDEALDALERLHDTNVGLNGNGLPGALAQARAVLGKAGR